MPAHPLRPVLRKLFRRLRAAQGPSGWWPGESALEIALGAILVQHAPWRGAARALDHLRAAGVIHDARALRALSPQQLEAHLRPAGTFRVKARRVRAFLDWLQREHAGDATRLRDVPGGELRAALLEVPGIGPETADAIALYAGGHPFFVIDASTRRLLARLGLAAPDASYDELQALFHEALPREAPLFNEYHAQVVRHGQQWCRARPRCESCPLRKELRCAFALTSSASSWPSPRPARRPRRRTSGSTGATGRPR
jgi:endonuclease-3 related protein